MRIKLIFLTLLVFYSCCSNKQGLAQASPENSELLTNALPEPTIYNTLDEQLEQLDPDSDMSEVNWMETSETQDEADVDTGEVTQELIEVAPQISSVFDHSTWDVLLKKYVSNSGNVSYSGFKSDRSALKEYISLLGKNHPDASWSKNKRLAYWINAYNVLTVDLIVMHYPVSSIKDIKDPWKQALWKLGDKWYNLDEIEHQILRKMNEPRIHFGIVCASFSCPKLINEAFTAELVDTQLDKAAREFINDSDRNLITPYEVRLSKIFQWFAKDFKTKGSLIDYVNRYSDVKISNNAKKKYLDYNWALNE